MSAESQSLLDMKAVGKSFATPRGAVSVLRDVNLVIKPGEFIAITGPSGAGKSTLLNLAALLDRPTTGEILFEGQNVVSLADQDLDELRKRSVGMVFQRFCLLTRRNVLENVVFRFRYLDITENEARRLALQALEQVGMSAFAEQPVRLLSGGEMQRVAIARAMAWPPRLLLVDEPTGNLDGAATEVVMQHFKQLNEAGVTILMATHNPGLLRYCGRQLSFADGRLLER